jgi:3-oxoacyl-[acyl-carrier protein] reductase
MKVNLAGRTALITGAGHGFGRAIAVALAGAGAQVIASDVRAEGLAETAAQAGPTCTFQSLDVTDEAAIAALMAALGADGSHVDILVNNAGGVLGQVGRPLEEVARRDWQAIVDVNLCQEPSGPIN